MANFGESFALGFLGTIQRNMEEREKLQIEQKKRDDDFADFQREVDYKAGLIAKKEQKERADALMALKEQVKKISPELKESLGLSGLSDADMEAALQGNPIINMAINNFTRNKREVEAFKGNIEGLISQVNASPLPKEIRARHILALEELARSEKFGAKEIGRASAVSDIIGNDLATFAKVQEEERKQAQDRLTRLEQENSRKQEIVQSWANTGAILPEHVEAHASRSLFELEQENELLTKVRSYETMEKVKADARRSQLIDLGSNLGWGSKTELAQMPILQLERQYDAYNKDPKPAKDDEEFNMAVKMLRDEWEAVVDAEKFQKKEAGAGPSGLQKSLEKKREAYAAKFTQLFHAKVPATPDAIKPEMESKEYADAIGGLDGLDKKDLALLVGRVAKAGFYQRMTANEQKRYMNAVLDKMAEN